MEKGSVLEARRRSTRLAAKVSPQVYSSPCGDKSQPQNPLRKSKRGPPRSVGGRDGKGKFCKLEVVVNKEKEMVEKKRASKAEAEAGEAGSGGAQSTVTKHKPTITEYVNIGKLKTCQHLSRVKKQRGKIIRDHLSIEKVLQRRPELFNKWREAVKEVGCDR